MLEEEFAVYMVKAKNHLKHNNYKEAIEQLNEALQIKPNNPEIHFMLANAWVGRFNQEFQAKYLDLAEDLALKAIEINPHYKEAYELKNAIYELQNRKTKKSNKVGLLVNIVLVIVFLAGSYQVVQYIMEAVPKNSPAEEVSVEAEIHAGDVQSTYPLPKEPLPEVPTKDPNDFSNENFPIAYTSTVEGIKFEKEVSEFNHFSSSNSFSYKLSGKFSPLGIEIKEATAKLELLDDSGRVIYQNKLNPVQDYKPRLRPGEISTIHTTIYKDDLSKNQIATIVSARLTITSASTSKAAASYPMLDTLPLRYAVYQPKGSRVKAYVRSINYSTYSYSKKEELNAKLEMVVENSGSNPLEALTLRAIWEANGGQVIESKDNMITFGSEPLMEPAEKRVTSIYQTLVGVKKNDIRRVLIEVVEIE